jgi:hypothetical protein
MNIYVTHKSNVLVNEDGSYSLQDTDDIGLVGKTHVVPMVMPHPESGEPIQGLLARTEVFWENKRYPAPHLEDSNDLFWTSTDEESEDGEEDDSEDSEEA